MPHLTSLGATLVVSEEQAGRHEFAKTLADLPKASLGLNSSGGAAAALVARALAHSSTLVTYGTQSRHAAVNAPLDLFTAADLTFKGFNASTYLSGLSKEARDAAARDAAALNMAGKVKLLVVREPFAQFSDALKRAYAVGAERQVTLVF